MVHCHGPYPSIATYLPPTATRGDGNDQLAETTPAWFRGNWAVAGTLVVGDASVILHNERFIEAAKAAFGATDVTPTTIVVNVNAQCRQVPSTSTSVVPRRQPRHLPAATVAGDGHLRSLRAVAHR